MSVSPQGAPYRLVVSKSATKGLQGLELRLRRRVWSSLLTLCAEGYGDIKPLKGGLAGEWRLRVGDVRVVYRLEGHAVVLLAVRKRENAY